MTAVRNFASQVRSNTVPVEDLVSGLSRISDNDRRPVEFIIAFGNKSYQLIRIRPGVIENDIKFAWIGSQLAFERFQEERLKSVDSPTIFVEKMLSEPQRIMSRLSKAMEATIQDPAIKSTGSFAVRVAHGKNGFEYLGSVFVYLERDITINSGEDIFSRMATPVEQGGFQLCIVEPKEPGVGALGLCFPNARLGIIFIPLEFDGGEVIRNISPNDFSTAVLSSYGVQMQEPLLRYPDSS